VVLSAGVSRADNQPLQLTSPRALRVFIAMRVLPMIKGRLAADKASGYRIENAPLIENETFHGYGRAAPAAHSLPTNKID
jgi:hypothetical protein